MSEKPKDSRWYVIEVQGQAPRLVRAKMPHSAVRHVIDRIVSVRHASQDDLIQLVGAGVKGEIAGDDPDPVTTGNGHATGDLPGFAAAAG